MGTLLMLITGIYGPWIWKLPVVAVIESAGLEAPAWIDPSYLLTDVLLAFLVACLIVIQIPTRYANVGCLRWLKKLHSACTLCTRRSAAKRRASCPPFWA